MSDNISFEIQVEIIKKLPIKPLLQFLSVSKAWKSMIDSSHFISRYSSRCTHMQPLFVTYEDPSDFEQKVFSINCDDHKVSVTVPLLFNMIACCCIIGSSHGLLCMYGVYPNGQNKNIALLWNISVRKVVPVVVPNVLYGLYGTVIGFGVCRETSDPKLVKIVYIETRNYMEIVTWIPWHVEVYALSTRVWRSPYSNLPRISIQFHSSQVVVDGYLYWLATDRIAMDGEVRSCNLIVSFDMTSEEFKEVNLPDILAHQSCYSLSMFKLKESLVVVEHGEEANNHVFSVWMVEDGFTKSFTKLITFNVNNSLDASVRGFTNNGEHVVEFFEDDIGMYNLVYEPNLRNIHTFGIDRSMGSYSLYPYMETLLLLDQPDLTIYDKTETITFLDALVS